MLNTGSPVQNTPPKNIIYSTSKALKEHVPCSFGCVSSSLVQKFTCKSDKLKISLFFFISKIIMCWSLVCMESCEDDIYGHLFIWDSERKKNYIKKNIGESCKTCVELESRRNTPLFNHPPDLWFVEAIKPWVYYYWLCSLIPENFNNI